MIRLLNGVSYRRRVLLSASRAALLTGVLNLLGGCATLGSESIVVGRTPVNEAVATTARQQTLMNIVRVYHNEPPVILDIAEADDMVAVGGSATGGVTGFGSPVNSTTGQTGSVSGMVSAMDAITNRYVPLQGAALISQLSSQITVETLNALYDSDWPIQSIIDFAMDRITPISNDYDLGEDLITYIDSNLSLSFATARSGFSGPVDAMRPTSVRTGTIINLATPPVSGGDTLNIYFQPKSNGKQGASIEAANQHAWIRLSNLYSGTQPDQKGQDLQTSNSHPNLIELRNSPRTNLKTISPFSFRESYLGPVMRTRTAVGILKYITSQPDVAFLDEDEYNFVIRLPWNSPTYRKLCSATDSYIVSPDDPKGRQDYDPHLTSHFDRDLKNEADRTKIRNYLNKISENIRDDQPNHINGSCIFSYASGKDSFYNSDFATDFGLLKRFVLVVESKTAPAAAFTTWESGGIFYSIMGDDYISQRNLMLVSQFLTIQAKSTPTPSLTTISPSGR